jgi:hypothetical protein
VGLKDKGLTLAAEGNLNMKYLFIPIVVLFILGCKDSGTNTIQPTPTENLIGSWIECCVGERWGNEDTSGFDKNCLPDDEKGYAFQVFDTFSVVYWKRDTCIMTNSKEYSIQTDTIILNEVIEKLTFDIVNDTLVVEYCEGEDDEYECEQLYCCRYQGVLPPESWPDKLITEKNLTPFIFIMLPNEAVDRINP